MMAKLLLYDVLELVVILIFLTQDIYILAFAMLVLMFLYI